MNEEFDKRLTQLHNETNLSSGARQAFDAGYARVREQANRSRRRKQRRIGGVVMMAAAAMLVFILSFDGTALAAIDRLFKFGDRGVDQVVLTNGGERPNATVTNQDVSITLERVIADRHQLVLRFVLTKEETLWKDVNDMSLDYRVRSEDGSYIDEMVSDTKPLKGGSVMRGHQVNVMADESGSLVYEVLSEASDENIPSLEGATIEIETVRLFRDGATETIDGDWRLPIAHVTVQNVIRYKADDVDSPLDVGSAVADQTSMRIQLSVNGDDYDENYFIDHVKLRDAKGNVYNIESGYSRTVSSGKTNLVFQVPFTSRDAVSELMLIVEGIGQVKLQPINE
ncbi:MAG: DUF4179 domain-containing protein [Exiguobacterium chiriqhucha]|uniref:DUF4179 domain-containing protein n=1 Tax=Exiguobacterium chiriqhucha TaxID=1385984 RepID=UPI00144F0331|nr:DUF4179 domain-containing protein [Exiguobacterium chiriqhucha]KAB2864837.1 MAG: DUF4179 domain-containing protein [Exiguobacterium chiriqhucha]